MIVLWGDEQVGSTKTSSIIASNPRVPTREWQVLQRSHDEYPATPRVSRLAKKKASLIAENEGKAITPFTQATIRGSRRC